MLADGQMLYAYAFDGYWKDVGTLDSLWEANMDLINPNVHWICMTLNGRFIQGIRICHHSMWVKMQLLKTL